MKIEIAQRRKSTDVRRPSMTELEEKPSTPLKPVGSGGPPVIVDFMESISSVEGLYFNFTIA